VLNREKFKINKDAIKAVLDFVRNDGEYTILIPQNVKLADEDDRIFYELYKSSEVDFLITGNRVGGCPLFGQPSSHTTVRTVRYTAVQ
jgi:predicted nucleic acid-binding protein